MQLPTIRTHNICGIKFSAAETAAAVQTVAADERLQDELQKKLGRRTKTERKIIEEVYHRIKDYNRGDFWILLQAAEYIYEKRYHLYATTLADVRTERQQKKDRRKRNCTEKLRICMLEIDELKKQGATWEEIIRWLKQTHRTQFSKEKISETNIRHLYYQYKKDNCK